MTELELELSEELKRFVELVLRVHRRHCVEAFNGTDWHVWTGAKAKADALVELLREVQNSLKDPDQRNRFRRHMEEARAGLFQSLFFAAEGCPEETERMRELRAENEKLMDRVEELQQERGSDG